MSRSLRNKKIVIIGGTSGLGLAAAKALIREGAQIVVVGRGSERLEKAIEELPKNAVGLMGDSTAPETAIEAIRMCRERWGGFDGLYHVAGGSGRPRGDGPLHELTLEGWQYTLNINLTSLMLSNQAAVKAFLEAGQGGAILNMSSVLGYSPSPAYFATHAYAAAKAAVGGFVRATAAFYAQHNIRINAIAPALVHTPMSARAAGNPEIVAFAKTKQPLDGGRLGAPEDLNAAVVYFLSDGAAYTTGQLLTVDGGWSVSEGQI